MGQADIVCPIFASPLILEKNMVMLMKIAISKATISQIFKTGKKIAAGVSTVLAICGGLYEGFNKNK
jgi:hypothetical protein